MSVEFKLPELGEGVDSADVAEIQVSEGETIRAEQTVMELETEKAVVDLPCPHAGTISKIHVAPGETIKVGQTLLTIEEAEEAAQEMPAEDKAAQESRAEEERAQRGAPNAVWSADERPKVATESKEERPAARAKTEAEPPGPEKTKPETKETAAAATERTTAGRADRVEGDGAEELPPRAGPATRRLARVLDVNLRRVKGSGPGGRIMQEDVVRAHEAAAAPAQKMAAPPLPDFSKFGPVEESPLNKLRQTAVRNLTASWQTIPHVTQHGLADITELERKRRAYLQSAGESSPKITLSAIAIKAVAVLLREFPRFNSSLDAERNVLILKKYFHIGVAVDTEDGLLVPVIRDADKKGINGIAAELIELAGQARERKLRTEQMQGATFTISNQGGIGGGLFTPIVNYPEVAILGLSRAEKRMLVIDEEPSPRLVLPLSLSYDHRVINGADAARFIERLAAILSDPSLLLFRT